MIRVYRQKQSGSRAAEPPTTEGQVGEIRVKVRLRNASDEKLLRHQEIKSDDVRRCIADAVVDTGAMLPIVPLQIVQLLGVDIRSQRVVEYADGRKEIVGLTDGIVWDIDGRDTLEEALVLGDEVLIGQTVLEKLDLLADCANRRLIPNPAHPDQPVSKVK